MSANDKILKKLTFFVNNYSILSIILLGFFICGVIFFTIKKEKTLIWENIFQENAVRNTFQLRKFLEMNESIIESLTSFIRSEAKDKEHPDGQISETSFKSYTSNILKNFTFIDGIVWLPKVMHAERGDFEKKMKKFYGDFSIKDIDAEGNLYVADTRDVYFPVCFIEPLYSHRKIIGFDQGNDKYRGDALNQALISGKTFATKKLNFYYIYEQSVSGIMLFTPVYLENNPRSKGNTYQPDNSNLIGLIMVGYKVSEMINRIFGPALNSTISLVIYDISDNNNDNIIYGTVIPNAPLVFNADIKIYGRSWRLKWQGMPNYIGGPQTEIAFHLSSAAAILFILLAMILHRTKISLDVTEKEVAARTAELKMVNAELKEQIAQKIKASEELVLEKERLEITLADITEGVIAIDAERKIMLMNKAAENVTECKFEDLNGADFELIFLAMDFVKKEKLINILEKTMKTGEITKVSEKMTLETSSGSKKVIEISIAAMHGNNSKIIGAIIVLHDVTEKIKIDEEMQKISKFETVSTVVGSIAHDFNNYLTGIVGNLSFARMLIGETGKPAEILMRAEEVAYQAKDLTSQLLTFSKDMKPAKKHLKIDSLIKQHTDFVTRGSKVECKYSIPENLWPIEADMGQITQVISNIVLNAMQAMGNQGIIEVSCENIVVSGQFLTLKPGNYLKICFKDNGPGISPENISKIFDPYFTTKSKGNGLGLASAFSIIKNHNGTITVDSNLNAGTSFFIYIPADDKKAARKI